MPVSEAVQTSDLPDQVVGILDGYRWITSDDAALTFSFAASVSDYDGYTYQPDDYGVSSVAPLSESERDDVRAVLAQVTAITGQAFTEVDDDTNSYGTLRYAHTDTLPQDFAGVGFTPGENRLDGDVWFSQSINPYDWFELVLHETGHALGLQHPHDGLATLDTELDGEEWTVMSYNVSAEFADAVDADLFPQTFMWLDILALQALYGVNHSYASGNDTYVFSADERYYLTLYDTGGTDRLDLGTQSADLTIDIRPGSWSDVGTTITYFNSRGGVAGTREETLFIPEGVLVEEVTGGAGDDRITGNAAANKLRGGDGDDTLSGGLGDDTIAGGAGNDIVTDKGAGGTIWLGAGDDWLTITGSGDFTAGGGAGHDRFDMGVGDDRVYAGVGDDTVTDAGGVNEIWLGDGADSAELQGAAGSMVGGRAGNDTIIGGDGDDTLFGAAGADHIDGGAGHDQLFGGAGDDTLTAGDGDDTIYGGAGADTFVFGDDAGDKLLGGFSAADGDMLHFSGFATADDLLMQAEAQEGGVLIAFASGGSLFLSGLTAGDLEAVIASNVVFDQDSNGHGHQGIARHNPWESLLGTLDLTPGSDPLQPLEL